MNKFYVIGNLTRDPELTVTASGTKRCRFSLAVNRRSANADGERQADFFDFTAFNTLAETIVKYCRKGNKLLVEGRVETNNYTASDGTAHYGYNFIAHAAEFLTPRKADDGAAEDAEGAKQSAPEVLGDDGDIPF